MVTPATAMMTVMKGTTTNTTTSTTTTTNTTITTTVEEEDNVNSNYKGNNEYAHACTTRGHTELLTYMLPYRTGQVCYHTALLPVKLQFDI
jgi:hypothetical protein